MILIVQPAEYCVFSSTNKFILVNNEACRYFIYLYAQIIIFKYIEERYRRVNTKLARTIEKQRVKLAKVNYDIKFLI